MTETESIAAAQEAKPSGLALMLLTLYVFFIYSRLFEASSLVGIGNLYVMLILSSISLMVILFSGDFVRAAKTPAGALFILFTIWNIMILPFSTWRSESLRVFTEVWLKSVAAFFIIAGCTRHFSYARRVSSALGAGAVVSILLLIIPMRADVDRFAAFGSLGNANEVAFHVLLGLPYLMLMMSRAKVAWKIVLLGFGILSMVLSLRTASRAGLIIAAVIILVALVRVSAANKVKILLVAGVGASLGFFMLDETSVERFNTLFHPDDVSNITALSAKESADVRKYKLAQSLELTGEHPIFGVGMGVFTPASADLSASKGERQYWIASHNAYTQISSETGLVGISMILGVFVFSLFPVFKIDKAARRLGLTDVSNMSVCVILSVITLAIHFFFDSIAYEYYLPMIAGISTGLIYTARPLIAREEERLRAERLALEATVPVRPGRIEFPPAHVTVPQGRPALPSAVPSKPNPNPFRLGRRRPVTGKPL